MGEIRLEIPDTIHRALKMEAGSKGLRLPNLITRILRDHVVNRHNAETSKVINEDAIGTDLEGKPLINRVIKNT